MRFMLQFEMHRLYAAFMDAMTEEESRARIHALMLLSANVDAIRELDQDDVLLLFLDLPEVSPLIH